MSDDNALSHALDWIAQEESDLQRQADAIDARLDVLREVKGRLTGTADNRPRTPRKRRTQPETQTVPALDLESVA